MSQPHRFQRKPLAAALGIAPLPLVSSRFRRSLKKLLLPQPNKKPVCRMFLSQYRR